jgi:hypothetical protein
MRNIVLPFTLLTVAIFSLPTAPAQAQSPRTFVSAAGSDSNPCSFAAPCRHFQAAVNATSLGGEVDALDPAGYGPITISQAVTIEGQGWSYIAPPANGTAITVNAGPNDNISIRGVSLNGVGAFGTTTGIAFLVGGSLIIENSVVRNFTSTGIAFVPNGSADLAVSNTLVANNVDHGIVVQPSGNDVHVNAVFNRVEVDYNGLMGIGIFGNAATGDSFTRAVAVDCVTSHNLDTGYYVLGTSVGEITATSFKLFRDTSVRDNTGVRADTNGVAYVSQSYLDGGNTWSNTSGAGTVLSYGDNITGGSPAPNTGTQLKD